MFIDVLNALSKYICFDHTKMMKRSHEDDKGDDGDNNDEGTHNGEDHEDEDENQC